MIKSRNILQALGLTSLLVGGVAYAADPTFVLKNDSNIGSIQVDVIQNGKSVSGGLRSIAKKDEFALTIPLNNQTKLELNYCKTAVSCKTELPEKLVAQFPTGKTMYIKFDGTKLEAQKGSFGKTTGKYSGLNINNNVKQNDITTMHTRTPKSAMGIGGMQQPQKPGIPAGYKPTPPPSDMPPALPAGYKPAKPTAPKPQKPSIPAGYKPTAPPSDMPPALPAEYKTSAQKEKLAQMKQQEEQEATIKSSLEKRRADIEGAHDVPETWED